MDNMERTAAINIGGEEVQIKLNGAQIVVETTLENLKKRVDK